MATIKAHNVNIVGSGEQHLVLAPGFGTDQSFWRYLVPHLMDYYRVILFDQMGAERRTLITMILIVILLWTAMPWMFWQSWKNWE